MELGSDDCNVDTIPGEAVEAEASQLHSTPLMAATSIGSPTRVGGGGGVAVLFPFPAAAGLVEDGESSWAGSVS